MKRAVCLLVNVGSEGCTANTLPARHAFDSTFSEKILSLCSTMPLEHKARLRKALEGLKTRGDNVLYVVNLTLHRLDEVMEEVHRTPVLNLLGDLPPSRCAKCHSGTLLVSASLSKCRGCGEEYRVRLLLRGDKLSRGDVERLLRALSECDSLVLVGETPRIEPVETLLEGVRTFWGLQKEALED